MCPRNDLLSSNALPILSFVSHWLLRRAFVVVALALGSFALTAAIVYRER
jgi:hypothetical protein